MAVQTTPHRHAPASWAERRQARATQRGQLAQWIFFASQTMFFMGLVVAKEMLLGPGQPTNLSIVGPALMTALIVLGSVTAQLAETAVGDDQPGRAARWLWATIGLGVGFVAGLMWVWATLPFSFGELWGLIIFTMTGIHVLHVLIGLGFLAQGLWRLQRGEVDAGNRWGVQRAVRFWHFLGLIWIIYFAVLFFI